MLLPLLDGVAEGVLGPLGEPFFEVQTHHGIADVVFAALDREVMADRARAGLTAITEISEVATLLALRSGKSGDVPQLLQTVSLAALTGISAGHLRSRVLPTEAHGA